MNLKELKEILQILEEKEITEFELEEEGMKLRIRKAAASANHSGPTAVLPSTCPPGSPRPLLPRRRPRRPPAPAPPAPAPRPSPRRDTCW